MDKKSYQIICGILAVGLVHDVFLIRKFKLNSEKLLTHHDRLHNDLKQARKIGLYLADKLNENGVGLDEFDVIAITNM